MKNGWTQYPTEKKRFWDLYLIRNNGEWLGFRIPLASLQRVSTYFVLSLCLLALSLVGWLFSRWETHRMQQEVQQLRLEREAYLKKSLPTENPGSSEITGSEGTGDYSIFPSLEAKDFHSILVEAQNFKAIYQKNAQSLKVDFELHRLPPRDGPLSVFWVMLLHGSPGILSFPEALTSRSGEILLYHRGFQVKDIKGELEIHKQFPLSYFVENAGAEPLYASLYLYDEKGSLLARYRQSLEIER
ncbi:MAG: hypothetical protein KA116_07805 [Proteobacteria bacterium]|nr:hypothetical protein [Pseudomonadota bacterium]